MCGIVGIYRFGGIDLGNDVASVRAMMDALHHRGPDDEGSFQSNKIILGHKRLSIIDLKNGHQPMSNDDESIWIVLNGEIYNYLELRSELINKGIKFRTNSDTEVLLRLYECDGESCVERLNGMFAFAIWDSKNDLLTLGRDRLGIKPLYYVDDENRFTFASEIKAFTFSKLIRPELNKSVLNDYIVLQMGLSDETLFKGVKKLLPGHILSIRGNKTTLRKYWNMDFTLDISSANDESFYVDSLRYLLEDSIKLQIRSDVPVGSHLSGGLDSSAVCCLASKLLGGSFKTFNGYFVEGGIYDESLFAKDVNLQIGIDGFYQKISYQDAADSLEQLIYFMDEPQAGPGLIPQYMVSKLAKGHVKVVLSGLGADETFGGYSRYYLAYLEECLKGAIEETQSEHDKRFVVSFESLLPNLPLLKEYVPLMKSFWSEGLFEEPSKRYFRLMRRDSGNSCFSKEVFNDKHVREVENRFVKVFDDGHKKSLLNKMLSFDLNVFIPSLLQVEDRTSMAVSLESRVPLLDHRIVELAAKMPPTVKWKGGRPKYVFREAVKNIVPNSIWSRKDKRGFPTPVAEWFNGPLKGYVHEIMTSQKAHERGLYNDIAFDQSRVTSHQSRQFDRSLWGALCIELWHRQFIDIS